MKLRACHIADLKGSGLTSETIEKSRVFSVNSVRASKILGWQIECGGLVFPYDLGRGREFFRVKPDTPYKPPGWDKSAKYLTPRKARNHLYIPPTLDGDVLTDVSQSLLLTEGEKKGLSATQFGFPCVALPGVWAWVEGKEPATQQRLVIKDFDRIEWEGRRVYIAFDSDAVTKPQVMHAERELAQHFQRRGAEVRVLRIPDTGSGKTGLDDLLVEKGETVLRSLIERALTLDEVTPPAFTNTDDGNSDRLAHRHGHDMRYVHERGWFIWDGQRWKEDKLGEVRRRAVDTVKAVGLEVANSDGDKAKDRMKWMCSSLSHARLGAMIAGAQSKHPIPALVTDFDNAPFLLNLPNGTIDLKTLEFRAQRRSDFLTMVAGAVYDREAECPAWMNFLDRVLGGSPELIEFVQKAIGYTLTGDTREECLFILHGNGQNGKSTFLEVIEALLGDYAMQTPTETLMARRNDGIPNDVARLKGARMAVAMETEDGRRFAESKVKGLTGGDSTVARFLHGEFFEFRPEFKLFLGCNHKPQIRGTDDAIWRRIKLIPFNVQIPPGERDPTLKGPEGKLRAELSGILNWGLQGLEKWQEKGLEAPDEGHSATLNYKGEMDTLGSFLEDCCEVSGLHASVTTASDIYAAYGRWCDSNGENRQSQKALGMKLSDRGIRKGRGTGGVRIWRGITVKQTELGSS